MTFSVTIGARIVSLAELTMGDLRRVPELAAAITTLMAYQPSEASVVFPSGAQIDALSILLFASATHADPTLERGVFDAAFNDVGMSEMFRLIAVSAKIIYGDAPIEDAPAGEAARPSS